MSVIFTENCRGVHCDNGVDDHTLCGDAYEGDTDMPECVPTDKRTVTCLDCIRILEHCRLIRFRKVNPKTDE